MSRRTSKKTQTTVIVTQASTVELTKRNSSNSLEIHVRSGKELLGTLRMGRGSVEWWPKGNSTNSVKMNWKRFVAQLEREIGS
jgi:hypothetical protein